MGNRVGKITISIKNKFRFLQIFKMLKHLKQLQRKLFIAKKRLLNLATKPTKHKQTNKCSFDLNVEIGQVDIFQTE